MTAPSWQDAHGPDWSGLAPGQAWAIPAAGPWQARLDRCGRAHVIGRALAEHAEHGPGYLEPGRIFAGGYPAGTLALHILSVKAKDPSWCMPRGLRMRPWHTFARANRAASYHERLWLAAKRTEAQAGQGGE